MHVLAFVNKPLTVLFFALAMRPVAFPLTFVPEPVSFHTDAVALGCAAHEGALIDFSVRLDESANSVLLAVDELAFIQVAVLGELEAGSVFFACLVPLAEVL